MTVDFQDHFWGEKQNGFDILYQNLKCGSASAKELSEFIKSRSVIEEYNLNLLLKLSRKTNQQFGTFQPLWLLLKNSTEKLSTLHTQTLQRLNILVKDVNKYCEEHYKKQKQIKNDENPTLDSITELREIIQQLNKSKEFYNTRALEQDRLRKDNASAKDLEKAEARTEKARNEYKIMIDKYRKCKEDYEPKFRLSCKNFEKIEHDHLQHMKDFLMTYSQILDSGHALIGQVFSEFNTQCLEMTTDKLLEYFIKSKGTGSSTLADIQFEEANLNALQLNNLASSSFPSTTSLSASANSNKSANYDLINFSAPSPVPPTPPQSAPAHSKEANLFGDFDFSQATVGATSTLTTGRRASKEGKEDPSMMESPTTSNTSQHHHRSFPDITTKWFNRSRKSKSSKSSIKNKAGSDSGSLKNDEPLVDAEGFTIRPNQPPLAEKEDSFSDSDSGEDSEDEKEKKIFVKINPLKNGQEKTASVDQLIASAGALTLAPPSSSRRTNLSTNPSPVAHLGEQNFRRSASATNNTVFTTTSNDFFDLFNPPTTTASAVPPRKKLVEDSSKSTNVQTPTEEESKSKETDRYAALSDIFKAIDSTKSDVTDKDKSGTIQPPPLPTSEPPNEDEQQETDDFKFIPPLPPKNSEATLSFSSAFSASGTLSKSFSSSTVMGGPPSNNQFSVYQKNQTLSKSFVGPYSNGLSRADSVSSLSSDFRMTPISFSSSRDASPLTISSLDAIPIAVSFQESIGGCFKGADQSQCKVNVIGCIKIAFASGVVQTFSPSSVLPILSFRLKNVDRIERIILSKELVTQIESDESSTLYELNMTYLQSSLMKLASQSPNARYYNLDMFKYQLKSKPGAENAPLQMVSYWKCDANTTNLIVDFKYNPTAFGHVPQSLKNVQITANLDGNVTNMVSQPEGKWDSLTKQTIWRFAEISSQAPNGVGVGQIKAKFDITNGPSTPSSIYAAFNNQDATISGLEFELNAQSSYRLSLVKKQFCSGRYYCEPKL